MDMIHIAGCTRKIGEPLGHDESLHGPIATLHVRDQFDLQLESNVMYSAYRPTPDELASLNAGGCVVLGIVGTIHPIIQLFVEP